MSTIDNRLTEMLEPAVEAAGFELVGIEYIRAGKHSILRLFIDHENGIDVDDCVEVSHQVSAVLDVEDPITTEYNLEVSSPGLDRPLFKAHHYSSRIGEIVTLQTVMPTDGRRKFKGEIVSVDGNMVTLKVDGQEYTIALANVKKANIVPQF
ncbi:ribosome maturation factor RimP [Psychrobium sp. 1_MG-2023]|uniref:ribosome maturation factor RimP n=1 Tax=Psychrobium sp. 1_MG-2023 TaxID=3062624 RepID=UPI000C34E15D|nr:ribosome maturation factor RimP [Psychrobium sp. 1_MG-2023]MDP2562849.1 ribosome maturation factor RimP [Psychrobium sp. 1_MG-2023]PKF54288.1 ribosome maturation factor RimP [Alteromonadales bacterium alter-6D02]